MKVEEYEDDYEPDEYERFEIEQDALSQCTCGAYQWSEELKRYIHVADCCCGAG